MKSKNKFRTSKIRIFKGKFVCAGFSLRPKKILKVFVPFRKSGFLTGFEPRKTFGLLRGEGEEIHIDPALQVRLPFSVIARDRVPKQSY